MTKPAGSSGTEARRADSPVADPVRLDSGRFGPARRVIYLHGFRSSARSFKARLLDQRLAALGLADRFVAPDLPPSPAAAIEAVVASIRPAADDLLIGSSLGGCYATWLAEQVGARAVLLNPAVRPARDLAGQVGDQVGYHDGQPFRFEPRYLDELAVLEAVPITEPARYLLVAGDADEVLDWHEMVARFPASPRIIVAGGDHGLSTFATLVDRVLGFGGLPEPRRR